MKRKSTNTPLRLEKLAEALKARARRLRHEQTGGLEVVLKSDYALIPLLRGHFAKVDLDDVKSVSSFFWTRSKYGYAYSNERGNAGWMHRFVMQCPEGLEVDHIHGDKLDNRKSQLRICTKRQQQGNRWKSKHAKTSKFKGVYFCKKLKKFVAYGREGAKNKRLGTFQDEQDAATAYNRWASLYFGEFAKLNPI